MEPPPEDRGRSAGDVSTPAGDSASAAASHAPDEFAGLEAIAEITPVNSAHASAVRDATPVPLAAQRSHSQPTTGALGAGAREGSASLLSTDAECGSLAPLNESARSVSQHNIDLSLDEASAFSTSHSPAPSTPPRDAGATTFDLDARPAFHS